MARSILNSLFFSHCKPISFWCLEYISFCAYPSFPSKFCPGFLLCNSPVLSSSSPCLSFAQQVWSNGSLSSHFLLSKWSFVFKHLISLPHSNYDSPGLFPHLTFTVAFLALAVTNWNACRKRYQMCPKLFSCWPHPFVFFISEYSVGLQLIDVSIVSTSWIM